MKKDCTKTHGCTLTMIILMMIGLLAILYMKWYFCDREREIENRQLQEMQSYHNAEIRYIGDTEMLIIEK